jgi:predicted PurR-regulated permease PerM
MNIKKTKTNIMEAIIVGWVFLVLSWIIPAFIKDFVIKRIVGITLGAVAVGVFIGAILEKYY